MQGHLPHPVAPISDAVSTKKKRGGYICGRCGLPKKGHICNFTNPNPNPNPQTTPFNINIDNGLGFNNIGNLSCSVLPHQTLIRQPSHLRRALSFDDVEDSTEVVHKKEQVDFDFNEVEGIDGVNLGNYGIDGVNLGNCGIDGVNLVNCEIDGVDFGVELGSCGFERVDFGVDLGNGGSGKMYLWELLRRLPPQSLFAAAGVCREWREMAKMIWAAVEELRLRVLAKAPIGFVGSVLQKCTSLVRLSLIIERDVDSMTLACIAFSCPNLECLDICMSGSTVNRITGDDLARFVADRRCLSNLKLEGCSNIGSLVLSSTSLSKLWLSDLFNLSKMVFNCPNLREISLDFSRLENDSTDLATMVGCLGRSSPCLQKLHIASVQLSNSVVLALTAANLRGLRMLSLVLGSEITDASVAAIASVYSNLELLDLSGSSITDSGIGIICNVFPETLSRLLLAVCPNITSSGIQFAAAQLPLLELMDCGMSICDPNLGNETTQDHSDSELQRTPNTKLHLIYQKLIIKHSQLKKLSLWGCSGLDALYLNCPQLSDLNLNSCSNLHPESLLLQCPNLEKVHATGCEDLLVDAIQSQVCGNTSAQSNFSSKRLPDGSKRVRAQFISEQPSDDAKKRRRMLEQTCAVIIN